MLKLHSYETFSTNDGPGIRLVLFLQGCHMRCLYCQNPDTQPLTSSKSFNITSTQILALLNKQKSYIHPNGGITFSGGEPTIQAKQLLPIVNKIKQAGFHTALDTCGALYNHYTQKLYQAVDLVILDVKHIDNQQHQAITGHSNQNSLKNASYCDQIKKPFWLRYVLVPGLTDDPQDLKAWAQNAAQYKQLQKVEILPYHTLGVYKYQNLNQPYKLTKTKPPSPAQLHQAQQIFQHYLPHLTQDLTQE